ncbi:MAG: nucleotidyltransferase family protein [Acidobacteriia bacterium]|nr:nucleotidyltransferase family protein [Terriglobia bacterium]
MISSLLLAAGLSRRYGREKLEELIHQKTLIEWAIDQLKASVIDEVIVVVNPETSRLVQTPPHQDRVKKVVNPSPLDGMSSSIRCGLEACSPKSEAVLIAHADMPAVNPGIVDQLASRWELKPGQIVAPRFKEQQGNPVIIPRILWDEVQALRGDVGCKAILTGHPSQIEWVEMDDDAILLDVDRVEDWERLRSRWN